MSSSTWIERKRQSDEPYVGADFNSGAPDAQYQRDRARIIHSAAFRRLQSKTQVLKPGESDFYRTRLTHSLEVAQLGSGICAQLAATQPAEYRACIPSPMLIEAICLAHDLGHPPFGHGGEGALNTFMKDHGGFEGNGQTLRIATRLGEYSEAHGLDLTRRTLLGLLKYPAPHHRVAHYPQPDAGWQAPAPGSGIPRQACKPPKCIHDDEADVLAWILAPFSSGDRQRFTAIDAPATPGRHARTRHKAFDTSIMELADDIAYGVHDLEDAIALRLVTAAQWQANVVARADALRWDTPEQAQQFGELLTFASAQLFGDGEKPRKHAISRIVGFLVRHIRIEPQHRFEAPLLDLQAVMAPGVQGFLALLKDFVMQYVILRQQVQELEYKGQHMLMRLFEVLLENPRRLLPLDCQQLLEQGAALERTVCDHLASMTDREATLGYGRLFMPGIGAFPAH
ncbi:dNTP triphosphohydrolase [Corticibacter populi]|uniref:Deoxyguanosinetriphosphate triphosphohydrolase-like protein n=1 Tax=Corticibacter populi TaxID=1550736 RepID=A0A3M6QK29_9BURK|nr:anti-phage deoxyguanosine triphosphatase [Corticibacter populi]RMX03438.1 dNTP triphosphohydrolase [Corticibacter populi]RZS29873.1 dGTPase [Corticibacter populi]